MFIPEILLALTLRRQAADEHDTAPLDDVPLPHDYSEAALDSFNEWERRRL